MADFKPGDVVVAVGVPADDPKWNDCRTVSEGQPRNGAIVSVEAVVFFSGECGLVVAGYPSRHPTRAWHHSCFRHLPKADEQFTAQMRACRPLREGQPA